MANDYFAGPAEDPDRYQLSEMRSRGGEGELWVGGITVDGQQLPVAVKVFHPAAGTSITDLHERVRGQAEVLRSIEHPNLVKVREVFLGPAIHQAGSTDASSAVLYMIMNWAEGENLTSWVARNPSRDPLQCSRIISRLAAAVDELHSGRGTGGVPVLHRDIKPANVIVNGENVKLVDFGLTRLATSEYATIAGSLSYMAPEVLAGARPTEAADQFGLGATAYFLFTGVDPNHNNPAEMRARLHQVPGIADSEGFCDHVMAMMERDPSRRPSNVVEWAHGLAVGAVSQTFARPAQVTESSTGVVTETGDKKRRGPLIAVLVIIILLALAGVGYLLTQGDDDVIAAGETTTSSTTIESTTTTTERPTTTSTSTSTTSTSTTSTSLPDSPGEIVSPEGIQYLADFTPVDQRTSRFESGKGNLSGEVFTRALMIKPGSGISFVEYDLGRKYTSLDMSVGLRDDAPSDASMKIEIYGDGQVLFDKTVALGDSVPVELDVTKVLRLRLQVTDLSDKYEPGRAIFADPALSAK